MHQGGEKNETAAKRMYKCVSRIIYSQPLANIVTIPTYKLESSQVVPHLAGMTRLAMYVSNAAKAMCGCRYFPRFGPKKM
mmetsp:Transcript_11376/g.22469  ORF Transcript_11376/g.22469 Transcript_11376/m.22469 type:complete len:80 (-) Transcript_11376:1292-1531(-)